MAKLKRTSQKRTATTGVSKQNNSTLYIGLMLAVAVAILVGVFITNIQAKGQIMVAKQDVPAFSTVTSAQLEAQTVPKDSITESDLTKEQFDKASAGGRALVNRIELLKGQRVPTGAVAASRNGSLSAVKQNERVVSLNATFAGSVAGIAQAGSVVDVYAGAGGGADNTGSVVAENAKVLALGVGGAAAANVRPGANKADSENNAAGDSLVVVLAVPTSDAAALLALSQASLALDPRLSFTENGTICPINRCAQINASQKNQPVSGTDTPTETPDGGTVDAPATDPAVTPDQPAGP